MSLAELRKLLPPPADPVDVPDVDAWRHTEEKLGTSLPSDYKQFLASYGTGRVDDFLDVFLPSSPESWNNLLDCLEAQRDTFDEIQRGGHPLSYGLLPAKPGLLPVGQTDNGDTIFYIVDGKPDAWKIAILSLRGRDVEVFDGGLVEFLIAAIRHQVAAFPKDFARPTAAFTPAEH